MKNIKSNPSKTVLTITIGFAIIALYFKINWLLYLALGIGIIGVVSDPLSKQIEWAWMKLALVLSFIVPNIVMGIIFFLFLFPISLLARVFRKKDALKLKNNMSSVYTENKKEYDQAHFENMW